VIVAVISVRVVQMAVYQVIHMITMGHLGVATTRAVNVSLFVSAAVVCRGTSIRVSGRHLQYAFVDMISVHMMQMAIV
jgi:hypothetical protein